MALISDKEQSVDDWEDPDDEELEQTPSEVVEKLGFDPLEVDWDEDENA